MLIYPPLWI